MVVFVQSGCIWVKEVIFVQKWLKSKKSGWIRTKVVVLGESGLFRINWLYLGKSGCIRVKWLYSGICISIRAMWLYSGKSGYNRANLF